MSGKRYPEEFKIEAAKHVTDRGYKIGEVAKRLDVTTKSLHDWIKKFGDMGSQDKSPAETCYRRAWHLKGGRRVLCKRVKERYAHPEHGYSGMTGFGFSPAQE